MKRTVFLVFFMSIVIGCFSQEQKANLRKLPSVDLKTLEGETINTKDLKNNGNPIIISFWALWCKNCVKELNAINDVYDDWKDETGVKIIAVSIDNSRSSSKVLPFVESNDWDYEVLLDVNSDFKRAMNVITVPHTFILNGKGEIVWQHNSYVEGSEEKYLEIVKKIKAGEEITD
ncbi:MAG: TlpA family protein disulfide reductase [Bacteroidales bacterium]|nr:TlpA family protein disulfide reductase [Bacteroidales bacterium]